MYDFCKEAGVNFDEVRKHVADDVRIGHSHSKVTQERGFGGHCFPKDVDSLVHQAKGYGVELSLLTVTVRHRNPLLDVQGYQHLLENNVLQIHVLELLLNGYALYERHLQHLSLIHI